MIILAIETSCDETAISVVEASGDIENLFFRLLGSAVHSQVDIHKEYGGVFPTLAKREHQKNLPLVLEQALNQSGIKSYELWQKENPNKKFPIDLIVVTVGPGLEPALWMGVQFAKELGKKWQIPVSGANHMEGHIASVILQKNNENIKIKFPSLALLISGGHTELIFMKNWYEKMKLGETLDDAVGEAFDKVARMLGLPYPGGPEISRLAEEARIKNIIQEKRFPRPMMHSNNYDFSFSGLKTAVLYYLKNKNTSNQENNQIKLEVAREFEDAVIDTLLAKTKKAIEEFNPKSLIIGGGVIANKLIREKFLELKNEYGDFEVYIPEKSLTTDNATMIAITGYIDHLKGEEEKLEARGNLDIS